MRILLKFNIEKNFNIHNFYHLGYCYVHGNGHGQGTLRYATVFLSGRFTILGLSTWKNIIDFQEQNNVRL